MMLLIIIMAFSYVVGSLNFSILVFRFLGKNDPRAAYSGNAGVTNVYRQAGMAWAALVLVLELGRAAGIALAARHLLETHLVPLAGLALVAGNSFPVFHGFRGGKGVANFLGFTACLYPPAAGISALVWVIVYAVVRRPFIASFFMVASLCIGTVFGFSSHPVAVASSAATALFIIGNHKKNIMELFQDTGRGG
jgi:acyl phosphate:glycerol-3-phosphate acyltransferase